MLGATQGYINTLSKRVLSDKASQPHTGVGGLRFASQVKCLHAHLAHTLAGGSNPVGSRVVRLIRDGDGAAIPVV